MIIALVFAERNMSYFLVLQKYGLNFRTRGSKDIWKIPMKGNLVRDQRHKWKRENEKKNIWNNTNICLHSKSVKSWNWATSRLTFLRRVLVCWFQQSRRIHFWRSGRLPFLRLLETVVVSVWLAMSSVWLLNPKCLVFPPTFEMMMKPLSTFFIFQLIL